MTEETIFKPGDTIVPFSPPFLKVLHISCKGNFCDNCMKRCSLSRCSGCSLMHYCGRPCQREDWKQGHSVECKSEVFKNPIIDKTDPIMHSKVLRTMAKFQRSPESFSEEHEVYGGKQVTFMGLTPNADLFRLEPHHFIEKHMFIVPLWMRLQSQDTSYDLELFSEDFLLNMLRIWRIHGRSIADGECQPNLTWSVGKADGTKTIRCIHPIPKGQEPSVCAIPGDWGPTERKQILAYSYAPSTCACELCTAEVDGPLLDYQQLLSEGPRLRTAYISGNRDEGLSLYRKLYHEYDERITEFCLSAFKQLHTFHTQGQSIEKRTIRNTVMDLERRVKITFGTDSDEYAKFRGMSGELGINIK